MKTGPAITRWIAGLLIVGMIPAGLTLVGGPPDTVDPPQLSTLLPPLFDRIGSVALDCLQWLASALNSR